MRSLVLLFVAGCWTGAPPTPPPRDPTPVNRTFAIAEIRAIRRCGPVGPQQLILAFRGDEGGFEVTVDHSERVPRTVIDGEGASFTPCQSHGCSIAMLTLDELEIGTRARGRYRLDAKAGPAYADEFEARWIGIPWTVECPQERL